MDAMKQECGMIELPKNQVRRAQWVWHADEGSVFLEMPVELSKENVVEFEYWMTGILNRLKRSSNTKGTP